MKGRDLLTKFLSSERKSHLAKASVMIEKCLGPWDEMRKRQLPGERDLKGHICTGESLSWNHFLSFG